MLKKIWSDIPKPFRASLIASFFIVIVVSITAGFLKNFEFGSETAMTGGFSVALLCAYVVCVGKVMAGLRVSMQDGPNEAAATAGVSRIMVLSLVRLFILAAVLVLCIVGLHFNVYAAIVGVSGVYLPLLIVPLLVKSDPAGESQSSPAETDITKVEE